MTEMLTKPPKRTLIKRISALATMDDAGTELRDASVLIEGHLIAAIYRSGDALPGELDQVIDARNCLATPGMVNTHHHMFQSLTRAVPAVQNAELFAWLRGLYPIWQHLRPEMAYTAVQLAGAELLLSGCTTSSDHQYLYPNGCTLDDSIAAARELGLRFTATRGSMTVGQSKGGLPPDVLTEREDAVLADCERVVNRHHSGAHGAMTQVALAPCSPFSVSEGLMRDSAYLGRKLRVRLHTHLAENDHDIAYTRAHFNCTPAEYAERLGWVGDDVWHAHCVKLDEPGIALFARTRTGVAHCPCSNMRLASGIAPIRPMLGAGVPVGLGVDGSASNDAGHMLNEARQAMLLARLRKSLDAPRLRADGSTEFGCDTAPLEMTAREALRLATRGGAQVLGRPDIGHISVGMCADLVLWRLDTLPMAGGALHDPVAALMLCASGPAQAVWVNGVQVVSNSELTTLDSAELVQRHNAHSAELMCTAS